MSKINLSEVPIDDLLKEAENRSSCFICSYETYEDKDKKIGAISYYGKGNWFAACRLSNILNNDVLNNWTGELRTLQRIHQDGYF